MVVGCQPEGFQADSLGGALANLLTRERAVLRVGQSIFQYAAPLLCPDQLAYVSRNDQEALSGLPRHECCAHLDWKACAVLAAVGTAQRRWPTARLKHDGGK